VTSRRNRAIIEILYASGIRVAELCSLKANAVNFQDGILKVLGKGSRERMVPCGAAALKALAKYLEKRDELKPGQRENALFLGKRGSAINRRTVYEIVRATGVQAGVGEGVHPHLLRHSFATHLLANGADLRAIQEMLGHASIGTTQIYTHADTSRLKDAFKRFFPRA
jgi:integrase/recombinase XerD